MSEIDFRDSTAIAGIGYSRSASAPGAFTKNSGVDVLTLAVRAARAACADAGIDPKDVDGVVSYQIGDDSVNVRKLLTALGSRDNTYQSGLVGGGNLASLSVVQAAEAVHHGICKNVIVFRALNGRSGVRMGEYNTAAGAAGAAAGRARPATGRVAGPGQFSTIYGLGAAVSDYAFEARRYMELHGVTQIDFAKWAVNARANATKNPRAVMRTPITVEDHQQSRMVSDPYHLFDCCLETDVGCAVLVTSAERARDLRARPALISAAMGGGRSTNEIMDTGLQRIGPRLLGAAGVELGDIDLFEAYDNFVDMPMRMLEDMGWCKRGEAKDLLADGSVTLDGSIPVNTHGGLINEGYCHGFNNILEAVQQLRGEAEDLCPDWQHGHHTYDREVCRQVRDAEIALNASVSGSSALILRRG